MGSVARQSSGSWRARWRTPDGRSRSKNLTRKIDAERWLVEVEHGKNTGSYIDPAAARTSVTEYATAWRVTGVGPPTVPGRLECRRSASSPTIGEGLTVPVGITMLRHVGFWPLPPRPSATGYSRQVGPPARPNEVTLRAAAAAHGRHGARSAPRGGLDPVSGTTL